MKTIYFILFLFLVSFSNIPDSSNPHDVVVRVKGMVCDFCARGLEKTFYKNKKIKKVFVNLDSSLVSLDFKKGQSIPDTVISKIIKDNGVSVVKINRNLPLKNDK